MYKHSLVCFLWLSLAFNFSFSEQFWLSPSQNYTCAHSGPLSILSYYKYAISANKYFAILLARQIKFLLLQWCVVRWQSYFFFELNPGPTFTQSCYMFPMLVAEVTRSDARKKKNEKRHWNNREHVLLNAAQWKHKRWIFGLLEAHALLPTGVQMAFAYYFAFFWYRREGREVCFCTSTRNCSILIWFPCQRFHPCISHYFFVVVKSMLFDTTFYCSGAHIRTTAPVP